MRDLDITTLRYLVAVCDLGNIARAADQEHIAPSAISKRIAELEASLGVPLLIRRRRGVAATPACEALLERARTMLFEMGRIESEMGAFGSGLQGQVRLLATPSAIAEQLLDDVAIFMREPGNRGIKVNIEELFTRDLIRVLRDGSNAIGVCWDSDGLAGLQQRPYRTDDLALAVHADHPLSRRKHLRFEQTLDYDHVGLQPTSAVQMALQRAAARVGRTINYRVTVSNFDALHRRVARSRVSVGLVGQLSRACCLVAEASDHGRAGIVGGELQEAVEGGDRAIGIVLAAEGDDAVEEGELHRIGGVDFGVGVVDRARVGIVAGTEVGGHEALVGIGPVRLEVDEDLEADGRAHEVVAGRPGEVGVGEFGQRVGVARIVGQGGK